MLLPFHNGVIKIAQKANVPLVIMTIKGTEQVKNNFPWKCTKIYIDVLETISAEELKEQRSTVIGEHAAQIMQKKLSER